MNLRDEALFPDVAARELVAAVRGEPDDFVAKEIVLRFLLAEWNAGQATVASVEAAEQRGAREATGKEYPVTALREEAAKLVERWLGHSRQKFESGRAARGIAQQRAYIQATHYRACADELSALLASQREEMSGHACGICDWRTHDIDALVRHVDEHLDQFQRRCEAVGLIPPADPSVSAASVGSSPGEATETAGDGIVIAAGEINGPDVICPQCGHCFEVEPIPGFADAARAKGPSAPSAARGEQ